MLMFVHKRKYPIHLMKYVNAETEEFIPLRQRSLIRWILFHKKQRHYILARNFWRPVGASLGVEVEKKKKKKPIIFNKIENINFYSCVLYHVLKSHL